MAKYSLLPEQLIHEGTLAEDDFCAQYANPSKSLERIVLSIGKSWTRVLRPKGTTQDRFPVDKQLIDRERTICRGTIDNTEFALQYGFP